MTTIDVKRAALIRRMAAVSESTLARQREHTIRRLGPEAPTADHPKGDPWHRLIQVAEAAGYSVGFCYTVEGGRQLLKGAAGATSYLAKDITIGLELSAEEETKALAHELGHVLAHEVLGRHPDLEAPFPCCREWGVEADQIGALLLRWASWEDARLPSMVTQGVA